MVILAPQNMRLVENRIFADIIKVRILGCEHSGLGQTFNLMTDVLIRDRKGDDTEETM
jgi:hypothetical protein